MDELKKRTTKTKAEHERFERELWAEWSDKPDDNLELCVLTYGLHGFDGAGWYYWDAEYPSEGSTGAFATLEEACDHAVQAGYVRPVADPDELKRERGEYVIGD